MPTAAKLIGAILFAALAWFISEEVKVLLPGEGRGAQLLSPINALVGAVMGWRIMGARAGKGFVSSMGFGLTTVFAIAFLSIVIWSAYEMVKRSVSGRYRGPMEALEGMGDLMLDYSATIVTWEVIGAALIGAAACGIVTEYFSRRWS